jgi:branched-chain amino acid transport system permease protein
MARKFYFIFTDICEMNLEIYWQVVLKAMVVIVLGGLGSIKGTLYAAIILGMVEIFVTYYLDALFALPIFLLVLIIVLVFKPKGLVGTWT